MSVYIVSLNKIPTLPSYLSQGEVGGGGGEHEGG